MAEECLKTFKEWNKEGRWINSGEKAKRFKNGEPLFSEEQTFTSEDSYNARKFSSKYFGITGPWDDQPF